MTIDLPGRIAMALAALGASGPRDLRRYLAQPGPDLDPVAPGELDSMVELILGPDPDDPSRLRFADLLRSWDNAKEAPWASITPRNTAERRKLIHELMKSGADLARRIDALLPFFYLGEPLLIAAEHKDWYVPSPGVRDYYWTTYSRYLRLHRGWTEASLLSLDNHTRAVVESLADPSSPSSYSSRGLVMGYVQSGKTANFIGVASRAADAGYRLVIVLAGTWNILRNQTQRRFDKELLGKELLRNDDAYVSRPPADWADFLEHGEDPVERGHYTWQRLTRPDIDFKSLKSAIDHLEFERRDHSLPLYSPANLYSLPAKLLVVKKRSDILAKLVRDFGLLRTKLAELPALIIDDESDQAGINTVDPKAVIPGGAERSKTNLRIVELLKLFPRGQYVGYTATPYANALVNPDDPEDLFPKDFMLPLDRPPGYMGVSDFFDPTVSFDDLDPTDYTQPEVAHIRRVSNPLGADDDDLKVALRSYVLAGGTKLFRESSDPKRYGAAGFRHHTMLVHTTFRRGEMASNADRLKDLWDQCAFNSPQGSADLEDLWVTDFAKVCRTQGDELSPSTYAELIPHLAEAIKRIEKGPRIFLIVNSDTLEAPDFSEGPVWKIVVGGNKLSRGYTIEGLTVSYYRRVAGTADTLMQMGRWFGFRPGYRDLVRVFLGVAEGRSRADLVSLFKGVCRLEDRFREEILRRYSRRSGETRITPRQVPALISVCGALPPTARNKMFNAILKNKNFGGQWFMPTLVPSEPAGTAANIKTTDLLLSRSTSRGRLILGGQSLKGKLVKTPSEVWAAANSDVVGFLREFKWLEADFGKSGRPADIALQIDFLEKERHGISAWVVVAPQRAKSFGDALPLAKRELTAKERKREKPGRGFQVFGEPEHRLVARLLAGIEPDEGKDKLIRPNELTLALRPPLGVILLYPVRETDTGPISIGFEVFFPDNDLPFNLNFTVRSKQQADSVTVERDN